MKGLRLIDIHTVTTIRVDDQIDLIYEGIETLFRIVIYGAVSMTDQIDLIYEGIETRLDCRILSQALLRPN